MNTATGLDLGADAALEHSTVSVRSSVVMDEECWGRDLEPLVFPFSSDGFVRGIPVYDIVDLACG